MGKEQENNGTKVNKAPLLVRIGRGIVRFMIGCVVAINVLCALGLICSCYAYKVSPEKSVLAAVLPFSIPLWLLLCLLLLVIGLLWMRRTAIVPGLAILICAGPIANYSPLNLPRRGLSEQQMDRAFTMMTYNVLQFQEFDTTKAVGRNRQLDYIMGISPDVVCLQEAIFISPSQKNHILQGQLDSLHMMYPYVFTCGEDFTFLSKYKAEPVPLDFPKSDFSSGDITAWRVYIKGRVINIFSVHLCSFGLTSADKNAFDDIVSLDSLSRSDFAQARNILLPKLKQATVDRVGQTAFLQKYLRKYGGPNAIVCGDFNDVSASRSLRMLTDGCGLREVYRELAFGPDITYNGNYFYFRIDHVLYRGAMRAVKLKRGSIDASDHYPLLVTFLLDE